MRTTNRTRLAGWATRNHEVLLTAVALPVVLLTALPADHAPVWSGLALAAATWPLLLLRTRQPVPIAALVVVLDTVRIVVVAHATPGQATLPAATMIALYTVGARCRPRLAWIGAVLAAAVQYGTALIVLSEHPGPDLLYLNWAMLGVIIGRMVRERRERIRAAEDRADEAERSRAVEARRQVMEERVRIARELHDVLAHHITVVNAQAGVAQYLLESDPASAARALSGIADNSRAALDELRTTLGLLRSYDTDGGADARAPDRGAPAPGPDQLPALIESLTQAGTVIRFGTVGAAVPLTTAGALALYRIAQEALTNAAKHAPGAPVTMEVRWAAGVTLCVRNPATPETGADIGAPGTGHGLLGMRERALAAGGSVTAGPTPDGGFRVFASLPPSEHTASPTGSP